MTSAAKGLPPIFILGAGRVGAALAALAHERGLTIAGLWTRSEHTRERAQRSSALGWRSGELETIAPGALLLLAISDDHIERFSTRLRDEDAFSAGPPRAIFHCSGARPAKQALAPLVSLAPCGTFHPLVAVSESLSQALKAIPTATIALEGDPAAVELGELLARQLGAKKTLGLRAEQMTIYHAAAVLASNLPVALWHAAGSLFASIGLEDPTQALEPLVRSVVDNLATAGLPNALTGPIRRGDIQTVRRHLEALEQHCPELLPMYRELSIAAIRTAAACSDPPPTDLRKRLENLIVGDER